MLSKFLVELKDRAYQFWQRNPLCVDLYNNEVIVEKLNYINNPVKEGLCREDVEYKFSSAKFYKELGDEFGFLTRFDDWC